MGDIIIRPAGGNDTPEMLTDLLHRAYKHLLDSGMKFTAATQSVETTRRKISDNACFVAEQNGIVIGTILFYLKMFRDAPPFYQKETVGLFGNFAVEPDLQKKGIGSMMLKYVEEFARSVGKKELALDTSENAAQLIKYYKKLGYKFVHYWYWYQTNYRSVIMAKTL